MTAPLAFDVIVLGAGPAGATCAATAAEAGRSPLSTNSHVPAARSGARPWAASPARAMRTRPRATRCASASPPRPRQGSSATASGPWCGRRAATASTRWGRTVRRRSRPPPLSSPPARMSASCPSPLDDAGVIGLAAATVLLKSHGVVPGRRLVVAGCGPLLAVVAAGLVKAGAEVAAVVDIAPRSAWLSRLPAILGQPRLAARGLAWAFAVAKAGVPILAGHGVRRVEGDEAVSRVVIGPVDADGAPRKAPKLSSRPTASSSAMASPRPRGHAAAARRAPLRPAARRLDSRRGWRVPDEPSRPPCDW